jgi:hypothetical protein
MLVLAGVVAAVAILASRPLVNLADWLPVRAQIGEASRHQSSPADKVQSSIVTDPGYATFPGIDIPVAPPATTILLWWVEADGSRPGHRHRIDRPPRRA